jgi:hypothetical protein
MKARPRAVERQVAKYMSTKFAELGMSPVERIPVLGRTGPDLSINESTLAIDAKSRGKISGVLWTVVVDHPVRTFDGLMMAKLCHFERLFADLLVSEVRDYQSKLVHGFLSHMASWDKIENNIPAVVLHRPGRRIADAIFVIYEKDLETLRQIYKEQCNVATNV